MSRIVKADVRSAGAVIRHLFVSPHAEERAFFYGVNFEFSYMTPKFAQTKYGIEMRPILGVRKNDYLASGTDFHRRGRGSERQYELLRKLWRGENLSAETGHIVKSPMVGTFYRASSPNAKPFAEVGQQVKEGDAICIIEAMKIMNEIEADKTGTITKILIENGQPVEFGQSLIVIE